MEQEFQAATSYLPNKADWFEGRWAGFGRPDEPVLGRRNVKTCIGGDAMRRLGEVLTQVPPELQIHKTLQRILDARKGMFESGGGFDWATAEAMAFGSLLLEGPDVRLSGQDSGRGTFSQRHAVWSTSQRGEYSADDDRRRPFEVRDSPLSEFGVLVSNMVIRLPTRNPGAVGGAIRATSPTARRRSSTSSSPPAKPNGCARAGWCCCFRTVSRAGPEHSSARLERYLQLCAEDNIQVANCTTPANYFHILRRQLLRDFRKPLFVMTPKSLLRHKLAASTADQFTGESHFRRILSDLTLRRSETRRLVLCSGKLAYELMEARDQAGDLGVEILRIEQLYPFPSEPLVSA